MICWRHILESLVTFNIIKNSVFWAKIRNFFVIVAKTLKIVVFFKGPKILFLISDWYAVFEVQDEKFDGVRICCIYLLEHLKLLSQLNFLNSQPDTIFRVNQKLAIFAFNLHQNQILGKNVVSHFVSGSGRSKYPYFLVAEILSDFL